LSSAAAFCAALAELGSPAELRPCWRELEQRADPHFFLSWHWIGSWLAELDTAPRLLTVRRDGLVVGLALLTTRSARWRGLLSRHQAWLNTTGDEALDVVTIEYNDILADRRYAAAVRKATFNELGRHFDTLIWRGTTAIHESFLESNGWLCRRQAEAGSAFVNLAQIRADGRPYLTHLSANTRQQVRRSMRLYDERGRLRFERAGTTDEALAFFREAGALHQQRWTARGKPGAFAYPFYVAMHERVITSAFPEGAVELVRVRAGSSAIGYLYNFVYGGRISFYFGGVRYDSDKRLKPGLVTHTLCIEDHLKGSADVYDFMAGDNRYKTSLGEPGPAIVSLVAEKPHPLLRLENCLRQLKQRMS